MYVYFIKCKNLIKIGKSKNPDKRLKQLQTGNPFDLKIIGVLKSKNSFKLETYFHHKYKSKHKKGEWYRLNIWDRYMIKILFKN